VLTLGNVIQMREVLESVPVVSVAPTVDFVTPTYGGRKPSWGDRLTCRQQRSAPQPRLRPSHRPWGDRAS
jgi:hypothetical protein